MLSLLDALASSAKRFAVRDDRSGRRSKTTQPRTDRARRVRIETLEKRALLTTAVLDGGWFDPNTWDDGVPNETKPAIIGHGVSVSLDGADHVAQRLVVHGNLIVPEEGSSPTDADKTLTTRWIHVNSGGLFQVGTAADRFDEGSFTITLTGTDVMSDHVVETNMMGPHMMGMNPDTMTINNNDGFLMTAMGGRVQFYGEDKLSFTKLAATADAGASTITVANVIERNYSVGGTDANGDFTTSAADDGAVNWEAGDQIVIASSSYDYTEEDVRTITLITDNGDGTSTLTLDAPLTHRHFGEIETYGQTAAPQTTPASQTYQIDMRAEVALLSRNVKVQGLASQDTDVTFGDRANLQTTARVRAAGLSDAEAAQAPPLQVANGVGAHIMIMPNSGTIMIDGVQMNGMGQASQKGRYPIHWHLGDDRSGDVLKNSSITNSNNRGVTIHGTSNLLIEGVVLHDVHGHGFFLEDAVETGNVMVANLALGIHAVGGNDADFSSPGTKDPFVVDTHDSVLETGSRFSSSAGFWITNPDNILVGNIVAGMGDQRTDDWAGDPGPAGTGYWYAIPRTALGESSTNPQYAGIAPIFAPFGQFDHNTSHSTAVGLNFDRGSDIEDATFLTNADVNNIQLANVYSPRVGGVKSGDKTDHVIRGFTNYKATDAAFYHRGEAESIRLDGLRVADSYNGPWAVSENIYDNSLFVGHSRGNNGGFAAQVGGPRLYDGAGLYTNTHFAGFAANNAFAFQVEGSSFGPTMHHAFRATSFENDGTHDHIAHAFSDFSNQQKGDNLDRHDLGRPAQWIKAAIDLDGTLTGGFGGGAGYSIVPNVDFLVDAGDTLLPGGDAWLTDDIYARIRVENNDDGQDRFPGDYKDSLNETLVRFTNRDGKVIDAIEGQNNGGRSWVQIVAKTDGDGTVDGTFTVEFGRGGVPTNGFVLNLKNQDGDRPELNPTIQAKVDAARIVVRIVGAANYTPGRGTEVFTDAALRSATGEFVYLRDAAIGDLYLNAGIDDSQDRIDFTAGAALQTTYQTRTITYGTTIQAEHFDNGIDGIAYHDTDAVNSLGPFRTDTGVDTTSTVVGDIADGEWLEYSAAITGNAYNVGINVSSTTGSGKVRLLAGLSNSSGSLRDLGTVDVSNTGGTFQTVWVEGVDLSFANGPDSVIRLAFEGGGFEVDSIEFAAATQTSFVPGRTIEADFATTTIELNQYDLGGQGAAYFDDTPGIGNVGDIGYVAGNDSSTNYRANEDVDADATRLQGKVFNGEWLEYTTNVDAGLYDITLKKAWGGDNNGVKLFIADANSATEFTQLGQFDFANSDNNGNIVLEDIDLTPWAGSDRVIRIEIIGNWMGLDRLTFASTTAAIGDVIAPQVESVVVNDGSIQRSMVSEINVTFTEEVVNVNANSFVLMNTTTNRQVIPTVTSQNINGKTIAKLTFSGAGIIGGSLADGDYTLTTLATAIADTSGNSPDGDATDAFFRLLGDGNGDRTVNIFDFIQFRDVYRSSDGDAFDFNGNGVVDVADFRQFRNQYRKTI